MCKIFSGASGSIEGEVRLPRLTLQKLCGVINERPLNIIFDTGAPLGFVMSDLVEGLQPVDRIKDFYPTYGPFDSDVFELPLDIGNERQVIRFGTFPDEIEQMHQQAGAPAIVGLALLEHYRISVGHRDRFLRLESIN